ncbi:arylsulfatase regulator [Brucella pituitosa]|uniref:arylsulfatase regulator n=1 Tax=Brucella pituitosa TaxID=571256 RepID=UPI001FFC9330|nr:arylsulfatase regulator [Brucella pituitosa]
MESRKVAPQELGAFTTTCADTALLTGAHGIGLLIGMADVMPDFKKLLNSPYKPESEAIGDRFPAFYRYATLLSNIAKAITAGTIKVPC